MTAACRHCCLASQYSNPSSLPIPSPTSLPFPILHQRTSVPLEHRRLSASITHAKFDKFEGESSPESVVLENTQKKKQEVVEDEVEEDDSCLPTDLEGAVRQSGQASALYVNSGGMRAIVELLIPQLQFLDNEGAQDELWELSRIFLDSLIQQTGSQKVKAVFPDAGAAPLLQYRWKDAAFAFSSLSDRKPVGVEDEIVVMLVPDYQMLEYVERIASNLSDDPPRPLIMWNPRLVSEEVGVGYNVRRLRKVFLRLWKVFCDDKDRPNRFLLAHELLSRPDAQELEMLFGDVADKNENGPSLLGRAGSFFSYLGQKI
ncbi:hypothetical protein AKJ16_DCAP20272 [Drosera capensis]